MVEDSVARTPDHSIPEHSLGGKGGGSVQGKGRGAVNRREKTCSWGEGIRGIGKRGRDNLRGDRSRKGEEGEKNYPRESRAKGREAVTFATPIQSTLSHEGIGFFWRKFSKYQFFKIVIVVSFGKFVFDPGSGGGWSSTFGVGESTIEEDVQRQHL